MRTIDPIKHEAKRREILAAAERCFLRKGLHGATISEICAEAKISPGHLYHYFPSKETIIKEMSKARIQEVELFLRKAESTDDLLALAATGLEAGMMHGRQDKLGLIFDMLAEATRSPAMAEVVAEHSTALRDQISAHIRLGQASGRIDPGLDADMAASIFLSVSDGLKTLILRDPHLNIPGCVDLLMTMFTRLLTPRNP